MKSPKQNLKLSRRLLSTYLMFGLLSIVAVGVGMVALLTAASQASVDKSLLTRLGHAAAEISVLLDSENPDELLRSVRNIGESNELLFCAVIDNDGVIQCHTSDGFIGQKSPSNFAAAQSPGMIAQVSYLHEDEAGPREYWIPLQNEHRSLGMLQVALPGKRPTSGWITLLRNNMGLAFAIPVFLLFAGGARLGRVVSTSTVIGQQLSRLADEESESLENLRSVEERGSESMGWNRLISRVHRSETFGDLENRLSEVMGGFREERYEQILQAQTDGVAVSGENGHVTFANEAFARLLELPLSDVVGELMENLLPTSQAGNATRFREQMTEPSRPGVVELWKSDDLADGLLRLGRSPLMSPDGEIRSQLWSLRDITQQKLIEHTRDQFVDTATHELRTPLSTIKACAEALELYDEIDVETQKHYVNTISNESTRLGRFVDEFLNISRMEAGSLVLNRHSTQLERLLQDAAEQSRSGMESKNIDFNIVLPPKLPELNIDKDKISAAVMNLLGNAEKYTHADGQVRLLAEVADNEVRIHVEDSGMGISPEELPRIFNKFFRSDDSRVRQITGTGLGLSFAQEVLRLHGGNLTATSELNHGSRFTMTLPLQER